MTQKPLPTSIQVGKSQGGSQRGQVGGASTPWRPGYSWSLLGQNLVGWWWSTQQKITLLDDSKDLDLKCRDFFLPPLLGIIVAQYRNSCSPSSTTVQPDKIEVFLLASCAGSCKELLVSCLAIPMIMFYCNFTYQQLSAIYYIYRLYTFVLDCECSMGRSNGLTIHSNQPSTA